MPKKYRDDSRGAGISRGDNPIKYPVTTQLMKGNNTSSSSIIAEMHV